MPDKAQQTLEQALAQPQTAMAESVHFNLGNIAYNGQKFELPSSTMKQRCACSQTIGTQNTTWSWPCSRSSSKISKINRTSSNKIRISSNKIRTESAESDHPISKTKQAGSRTSSRNNQINPTANKAISKISSRIYPISKTANRGISKISSKINNRANRPVNRISHNPISRMVKLMERARSQG